MSKPDWKDLLNDKLEQLPANQSEKVPVATPSKKQDFIIRFEKRNGKPATIVSNFQGSEAGLKELAASLKKFCGTGGSAKDDEILIQGDVRSKVADYLTKQGHKVRGDFKK
ncbi:MAG TPA: translation initiation factor [Bacteroidales bacterium]|nr:translation initiation factor [Bacteroidales bacterium]